MNTNHQSANSAATENKRSKGRKGWIIGSVGLAAIAIGSFFLFGMKQDEPQVYGKYKAHSENPDINRFLMIEDMYFQINTDKTIVYNSTINGKPKSRFEGSFTLDEETNTLNIHWKAGKIPSMLKIEKEGEDYVIKQGNVNYIKQGTED